MYAVKTMTEHVYYRLMEICYLSYKRTYAGVHAITFYVGSYLVAYIL